MTTKDLTPQKRKEGMRFTTKHEEKHPILAFQEEMNALMDNFFRNVSFDLFEKRPGPFSPSIDIMDTEKEVVVTAELPGVDENNIDISITKDTLTIKGEKKAEKEEKGKDFHLVERSYGSFIRTIPLPVDVETEKVGATYKKGVLTIKLPKTEKALKETKKIPIKSE